MDTHRFVEKRGGPKIATSLEKMVINWWIWGFSVFFSDNPKWAYNYTCPTFGIYAPESCSGIRIQ